jgi:hypothetical protein
VLSESSVTVSELHDMRVVALHGELDVVSADGVADALVEEAGPARVVEPSASRSRTAAASPLWWRAGTASGHGLAHLVLTGV